MMKAKKRKYSLPDLASYYIDSFARALAGRSGSVDRTTSGHASGIVVLANSAPAWAHIVLMGARMWAQESDRPFGVPEKKRWGFSGFPLMPYVVHTFHGSGKLLVCNRAYCPVGIQSHGVPRAVAEWECAQDHFKALREVGALDDHGYIGDCRDAPKAEDQRAYMWKLAALLNPWIHFFASEDRA